jgi:hypothetical protein
VLRFVCSWWTFSIDVENFERFCPSKWNKPKQFNFHECFASLTSNKSGELLFYFETNGEIWKKLLMSLWTFELYMTIMFKWNSGKFCEYLLFSITISHPLAKRETMSFLIKSELMCSKDHYAMRSESDIFNNLRVKNYILVWLERVKKSSTTDLSWIM